MSVSLKMCKKIYQYAICINNIPHEILESSYYYISHERQMRADRYKFNMDRVRCIFGEVLLKYALSQNYAIQESKMNFSYNQFGKPYLSDYSDIHFNISHSGGWVVCAVGDAPIGVDVEQIDSVRYEVIECFTVAEQIFIRQCISQGNLDVSLKLWTLKESYIKAIGKGLNIPLNSFEIRNINDNRISLYIDNLRCDEYRFVSEKIDKDCYFALCTNISTLETISEIKIITVSELLKYILFQIRVGGNFE